MADKIKVQHIELACEGISEDVNILSSYEDANKLLCRWSDTAPRNGGYNKCHFKIVFEDGETYEDRYDLKHWSCLQDDGPGIDLKRKVGNTCRFVTGSLRPDWMNDGQWERSRKMNKLLEGEYKKLLEHYDVLDDAPTLNFNRLSL